MANKRISELTSEVTTPEDDDYIALDGSNGTRKMAASVLANTRQNGFQLYALNTTTKGVDADRINFSYEENGSDVYFYNKHQWIIRGMVTGRTVTTSDVATECGVELVTSPNGVENCIKIEDCNSLVFSLVTNKFSIKSRESIVFGDVVIVAQVSGRVVQIYDGIFEARIKSRLERRRLQFYSASQGKIYVEESHANSGSVWISSTNDSWAIRLHLDKSYTNSTLASALGKTLVTSPNGVENCIKLDDGETIVITEDNALAIKARANTTIDDCVILQVLDGKVRGFNSDIFGQYVSDQIYALQQQDENLEAKISAVENSPDAYHRVKNKAVALEAACRRSKTANDSKDFQLLILTDSHGDATANDNAVLISNGFASIDAIIQCGDVDTSLLSCNIRNTVVSSYDYSYNDSDVVKYIASMEKSNKPYYNVIGNHEAGTFNYIGSCPNSATMYGKLIKPMVDAGYLASGEYTEGMCYYFHDFADAKIRLIVLNEYDSPLEIDETYWTPVDYSSSSKFIYSGTSYTAGTSCRIIGYTDHSFVAKVDVKTPSNLYGDISKLPRYKLTPGYRYIRQTQAQWFLDTLASTPANYGVIVAMHNPFSDLAVIADKKFSEPVLVGKKGSDYAQNNMVTDFIANAVHAFHNKSSYGETVTMKNGDSYAVSKDFSSVASGVKFICYLGGHAHHDMVWQHPTYTEQWQVTPTCSDSLSYASTPSGDIRRTTYDGYAKDSLTSVSFNYTDRAISLVKLGVDVTENMEKRDFEKISLS